MNLSEALKYGVLADFHSGDKRDQFAGLLHTTATDPQFGMGLLADFADEHEHPLAPVFRRLASGEAVREGSLKDIHRHLIDNTLEEPSVSLSLHNKTANKYDPYARVELHHHFEHGPVWVAGTHTGWKKSLTDSVDDWPEHSHTWVLPAHPEEVAAFQKALEAEPKHQRSAREVKDFQARSENMQHYNTLEDALKYDTEAAKGLAHDHSGNSPATQHLRALIGQIVNGDNHSIGIAADLLRDADHPAADLLSRVYNGEGQEGDFYNHYSLHSHSVRKDSEFDADFIHYLGLGIGGGPLKSNVTIVPVRLKDGLRYFQVGFAHRTEGGEEASRSFLLPSDEQEMNAYGEAVKDIHPAVSNHIKSADKWNNYSFENSSRRRAGVPELIEEPEHHTSLEKALKYVTAQPEDMLHLLSHSGNESSLIWADLLDDHFHSDLANRVRREADGSAEKRPQPEDNSSSQDDVQWHLHTKHPSPAIRALADGTGDKPQLDYLVRALRLSPAHADQDAGVWLAPAETPHQHHAASTHFKALSNRRYREAGLVPKLVGDTLYLLDWEHPPEASYSAPAIRYHAPVSDRKDLDGMVQHAEQLLRQRQEQQLV